MIIINTIIIIRKIRKCYYNWSNKNASPGNSSNDNKNNNADNNNNNVKNNDNRSYDTSYYNNYYIIISDLSYYWFWRHFRLRAKIGVHRQVRLIGGSGWWGIGTLRFWFSAPLCMVHTVDAVWILTDRLAARISRVRAGTCRTSLFSSLLHYQT